MIKIKNVIVEGVYIVGMHHLRRRELEVDAVQYCAREQQNPYDRNAVSVFSDSLLVSKVAYFRRKDAALIPNVFQYVYGKFYLKAMMAPEKFSKYQGPMQQCNIGFKCNDQHVEAGRRCSRTINILNSASCVDLEVGGTGVRPHPHRIAGANDFWIQIVVQSKFYRWE